MNNESPASAVCSSSLSPSSVPLISPSIFSSAILISVFPSHIFSCCDFILSSLLQFCPSAWLLSPHSAPPQEITSFAAAQARSSFPATQFSFSCSFACFYCSFFYETLLKGSECYLPLLWFLKNGIQVKFVSNVVTWGKKTEYYSLIQTKVCMTWHFSSSFFWTQQLGLIHTGWKAGFLHIYK